MYKRQVYVCTCVYMCVCVCVCVCVAAPPGAAVMPNQHAINEANRLLVQFADEPDCCDRVCKSLVELALARGTEDNTSVVLIWFQH